MCGSTFEMIIGTTVPEFGKELISGFTGVMRFAVGIADFAGGGPKSGSPTI